MKKQQVGRLAMRVEGDKWTAYYAMPDTMQGAIYLGQIMLCLVQDRLRKEAFMDIMRRSVGDIIEEKTGIRPSWPEPNGHPAPEHEKAGRA